jgi:hypothetical protein
MGKKWDYFHVDCGHFPVQIKLCFSNQDFQKVLKDHDITMKATALDEGIAETHYLSDGKEGIIIMVFDLEECDDEEPAILTGLIAHEATHCVCRVFEHIGEDPEDIGEESRAYLTEHIVRQIAKAIEQQKEKDARKTSRKSAKQKGEAAGGTEPEVDKLGDGGAGSDSVPKRKDLPGGAQDKDRKVVRKTKSYVPRASKAWISRGRPTRR